MAPADALKNAGSTWVGTIVVGTDERVPLTDAVLTWLTDRGFVVDYLGPSSGEVASWSAIGRRVAGEVAAGNADTGVLFCWTGTGASIAANKIPGVRAALCADAQTATGARRWNDANVLVMSNRLTSPAVAEEILEAWFAAEPDASEAANIEGVESPA